MRNSQKALKDVRGLIKSLDGIAEAIEEGMCDDLTPDEYDDEEFGRLMEAGSEMAKAILSLVESHKQYRVKC